jgi:two-component system response regulator DevR
MTAVDERTRVFLLDDHEVVREGVRSLLESSGSLRIVGEASTCAEALARIPATRPDVAVLDVRLPDGSGVEVCRELQSSLPNVRCLMLTSFADEEAHLQSVMAGAAGYVLKQLRGQDLVRAIERVAGGESLIDPSATGRLLEQLRRRERHEDTRLASLTSVERRMLELIADGLTNRQIAHELLLAEKTVKNHVSAILSKLGMARRTEAAVFAVRAGATCGS